MFGYAYIKHKKIEFNLATLYFLCGRNVEKGGVIGFSDIEIYPQIGGFFPFSEPKLEINFLVLIIFPIIRLLLTPSNQGREQIDQRGIKY